MSAPPPFSTGRFTHPRISFFHDISPSLSCLRVDAGKRRTCAMRPLLPFFPLSLKLSRLIRPIFAYLTRAYEFPAHSLATATRPPCVTYLVRTVILYFLLSSHVKCVLRQTRIALANPSELLPLFVEDLSPPERSFMSPIPPVPPPRERLRKSLLSSPLHVPPFPPLSS